MNPKLKRLTLLAIVTLLFTQCKKDQTPAAFNGKDAFTEKAKRYLTGKMPAEDFARLDWRKTIVYKRIFFKGDLK